MSKVSFKKKISLSYPTERPASVHETRSLVVLCILLGCIMKSQMLLKAKVIEMLDWNQACVPLSHYLLVESLFTCSCFPTPTKHQYFR